MKAKGLFSLSVLFLVLFSGCASLGHKQTAAESAAIYATQKAISAGRFDLAKSYSDQAARLAVPPKKQAVIAPLVSNGTRYVVLPQEYSGTPALAIGSPAADTVISKDKALQSQLSTEQKAVEKTTAAVDSVLADREKVVEKAQEQQLIANHSFWGKVRFWGIVALVVAGLVAACYFFPPLLGILASAAKTLGGILGAAWGAVANFFKSKSKTE